MSQQTVSEEASVTVAQKLREDPAVQQSIQTLLDAIQRHQASITGPREADPELAEQYQKTVEEFYSLRGGKLFFPFLGSGIGKGSLVELDDGSVKYDFINGIGVHHFGHSHPKVTEAMLWGAMSDAVMEGNLQQNTDSHAFSKKILEMANIGGAGFDHCFLTSCGVMAGENALKIAMQKKFPAHRVLAFEGCFAGRTTTFSQITDKPKFREGLPSMLNVHYIPFYDESSGSDSIEESVTALKAHLARYPGEFAAMIFELVQGEGGFYTAPVEFHRALIDVLKENNVAVLFDEVQTFARTHALFAYQHYELDELADIVWFGKASQVCGTLFRKEFAPRPGLLSQTFTASSGAIHAGCAILEELDSGGYFGSDGKIARQHAYFRSHLERLCEKYPDKMAGPFGIGAMVALTPFGGEAAKVQALLHDLYRRGVMGFIAGGNPMRFRFLIPIGAVTEADIDAVVEILDQALAEAD